MELHYSSVQAGPPRLLKTAKTLKALGLPRNSPPLQTEFSAALDSCPATRRHFSSIVGAFSTHRLERGLVLPAGATATPAELLGRGPRQVPSLNSTEVLYCWAP